MMRSLIGSACLICLLITFFSGYKLAGTIDSIDQMQAIDRNARSLLISVLDAETGQRGYIITKNQAYLDSYSAGISSIEIKLKNLRVGVSGTAASDRIEAIEQVTRDKINELKMTLELREIGFEVTAAEVKRHIGKNLMDQIRQHLDEVELWSDRERTRFEVRAVIYGRVAFFGITLCLASALFLASTKR